MRIAGQVVAGIGALGIVLCIAFAVNMQVGYVRASQVAGESFQNANPQGAIHHDGTTDLAIFSTAHVAIDWYDRSCTVTGPQGVIPFKEKPHGRFEYEGKTWNYRGSYEARTPGVYEVRCDGIGTKAHVRIGKAVKFGTFAGILSSTYWSIFVGAGFLLLGLAGAAFWFIVWLVERN